MTTLALWLLLVVPPVDGTGTGAAEQLLRVVSYDRNLDARTPDGLRLAIVHHAGDASSLEEAGRVLDEVRALERSGSELAPEGTELFSFSSPEDLYRALVSRKVSALYVSSGFGSSLPDVIRAAQEAGVTTLSGTPADVERGIAVGVVPQSRKVVVNMAAAERCGVDLDPAVRQVAQRVGAAPGDSQRSELAQVMERYRDAIRNKDLASLRALWPGSRRGGSTPRPGVDGERAVPRVHLALLRIDGEGAAVRVRVRRVDRLVTRDGQTLVSGRLMELVLKRSGTGEWLIESMGSV